MKNISYGRHFLDDGDIAEVVGVLKSDWLSQGPKIKEFEKALCSYTGAKYAVVVSSGTAALHVAALAAGIKEGDEVITSPMTFLASANCVLYCGGRPVFADVRRDDLNIDTLEIRKKVTPKTKALIPVHYSGNSYDAEEIKNIAEDKGLIIIEDAAHALGASYRGSKIGSCRYSDIAILSFHPTKSITTGEGGAVLTNNADYYGKLLMLRNHGTVRDEKLAEAAGGWYYEMRMLGFNYRMTDMQAALGISQLKKLDKFVEKRKKIALAYQKAFKNNPYFDILVERKDGSSSCHLYPILLKDKYKNRKKEIFSRMRKAGMGVQTHYIPVHTQPFYRGLGYKEGACPVAEGLSAREISIPIHPAMTDDDVDYVIKNIPGCFNRALKETFD